MKALLSKSITTLNIALTSSIGRLESIKNFVANVKRMVFCGAFNKMLWARVRVTFIICVSAFKCVLKSDVKRRLSINKPHV